MDTTRGSSLTCGQQSAGPPSVTSQDTETANAQFPGIILNPSSEPRIEHVVLDIIIEPSGRKS